MTNSTFSHDLFGSLSGRFGGFGRWVSRAGFGLFVLVAAGVALLATTFIGLMLAAAAVIVRVAHAFSRRTSENTKQHDSHQEPRRMDQPTNDALNARSTPSGWVVDAAPGN